LAIQIVAGLLMLGSRAALELTPTQLPLAQVLCLDLSLCAAIVLCLRRSQVPFQSRFWPTRAEQPLSLDFWLALGLAYPAWLTFDLAVLNPISERLGPAELEQVFENLLSQPVGLLSICLSGPVLEEVLFRGIILDSFLRRFSKGRAIVLAASLFALMHGNWAQLLPALFLGMSLSWIYAWTRSLWPCLVIHVLHNSLIVWLSEGAGADDYQSTELPLVFWPGLAVLSYLAYRQWRKLLRPPQALDPSAPE